MADLPTGTITFLSTDIEGSTTVLERLGDHRYAQVLEEYRQVLRTTSEETGGQVIDTQGDAFLVAFRRARDGVTTAVTAQRAIKAHLWPDNASVRVRMALHTGEPMHAAGGYVGLDVHRAARICSAAHGGQVLLSQTTGTLVEHDLPSEVSLRELGAHRLKDLQRSEKIFQVLHPDLPAEFPPLKSLDTLPNNLPVQLTSFIGLEREIVQVKHVLATTRLLTLTGAGGCGKTRLALQVAAEMLEDFAEGVWLVELATLSDPTLVPQAVASALNVREQPGRPLQATLADYLSSRELLLVLDNCEHLVAHCARLAETLLRACPHLRILATSREALGIAGETIRPVPSLSVPDPRHHPTVETLRRSEATRLFIERAIAVLPTFSPTGGNAENVTQVCQRLDGIPLAIELAAARVKVLTVEQIAARVDDRFRLLTGGSRTALPRHQTLRATMDWSYDLLSEAERVLLRRLSVFAGGFTLEAVEAVCTGAGVEASEVLDLLTHLVDKSLVVMEERGGTSRYRLLDTVRQYSRDKLLASGEAPMMRGRHQDWYLQLAERAEPQLQGPDQRLWLDLLEMEHDNLRTALDWSKAEEDGSETGLRLAGVLWWFWFVRGYLSEGRERLEGALSSHAASPSVRGKALAGAGALAGRQGDYRRATALCEESLALCRKLGDQHGIAFALNALGFVARQQGDYERAAALCGESLILYREQGDRWGAALVLFIMGESTLFQGDHRRAQTLLEESLVLYRDLGDKWGVAFVQNSLGLVSRQQGDYERAAELCEGSLSLFRELDDKWGIASVLRTLGLVAHARRNYKEAASLYDEGLALFRELGDKWSIASSLRSLGLVAHHQGDFERATALCEEGLTLFREIGDKRGIADSLQSLGVLARDRGDYDRAVVLWKESLDLFWKVRDKLGVAQCLRRLGETASRRGQVERAARLMGAVEFLGETLGARISSYERSDYERHIMRIRETLQEPAFGATWAQGRAMPLEQAIAYALGSED